MSLTAQAVIERAAYLLNDTGYTVWSRDAHLASLNEGRRLAATARPDLYQTTTLQQLLPGARQLLPTDAVRLTEVTRNVCGQAITLVERDLLDRFDPCWLTGRRNRTIKHYSLDERDPNVYWVYPPAPPPTTALTGSIDGVTLTVASITPGGAIGQGQVLAGTDVLANTTITEQVSSTTYYLDTDYDQVIGDITPADLMALGAEVQLVYEVKPTAYVLVDTLSDLEEIYAAAWADYICYRAWSVDVEAAGSAQQAQTFGQMFMQTFNIGRQADMAHSAYQSRAAS